VSVLELSAVLFAVSVVAGGLGSLLGLGGGFVIVPVLTLVFHLDIRLAIGTSIVAVAATSSAGAARNVTQSMTNLRVATFLAMATTIGAVTGALLAKFFDARVLFALFGLVLAISGIEMERKALRRVLPRPDEASDPVAGDAARRAQVAGERAPAMAAASMPGGLARARDARTRDARTRDAGSRLAERLALDSAYYDQAEGADVPYAVAHTGLGLGLMYVAGMVSGLLGIGSGVLKVPAMDLAMHIPMKVSTATSNLLIGLTAAASAVVYFARGDIDPIIAGPVALGVLAGATVGSKLLHAIPVDRLRLLFVLALLAVAVQMLWKGIS
jgi:hypothetical protein